MKIYIDASREPALWRAWGMTLLERLLRQLERVGARRVLLRCDADWRGTLRPDHPGSLEIVEVAGPPSEADGGLVLHIDAGSIVDPRVLAYLLAATGPMVIAGTTSALVTSTMPMPPAVVDLAQLPAYIAKLRRYKTPYLFTIHSRRDLRDAELAMFDAVYKGVTDVVTKYVYPGIVRMMTGWLAPTRITPNQVTAVSMVLSFGAIPVFLAGHLGLGVVMGLLMSVLDSVDGKLARLTLRESRTGNWMDHGSDTVYFGIWLVVVGQVAGIGSARWLLPAAWLVDKTIVGLFQLVHKRELNDWAPIDAAFRLVVIRRNIFLIVLGAGVLAGAPQSAVFALAAWAVFGVVFHVARALWIVVTGEPARASRLHGESR